MGDLDSTDSAETEVHDAPEEQIDPTDASSVEHSEGDDDESESVESNGLEACQKKKKKKKKKKKPAKEEVPDNKTSIQQPIISEKPSKEVIDKRFNAAMEALRNGDDLWINLANINLHDGKAKKVVDALKSNVTATALDLSGNCISDAGAQALASVLGTGGGAELIELDLRGNNFTDLGLTALEGLGKLRKLLKIRTGSLFEPEEPAPEPGTGGKEGQKQASGQGKFVNDLTQGPMFKKYFQTGGDDEEDGTLANGSGADETNMMDYSQRSGELWDQLKEALAGGKDNVPAVSSALWTICIFLDREVSSIELPQTSTAIESLKPHLRQAAQQLPMLDIVMQIVPEPVTVQFSNIAQAAVGSHRLWAAEVVALLLHLGCAAIDREVASSQLVPQVLELALSHPLNNALHSRTLRILHSSLHSPHTELWAPLLEPQPSPQTASLQQRIAEVVINAREVLPGKRTGIVGFALDATRLLHSCLSPEDPGFVQSIHDKLMADEAWTSYWKSEAALELWKEHEGCLGGGERPKKYDPVTDDQKELEAIQNVSHHSPELEAELIRLMQKHGWIAGRNLG